ncbi:hypothetical protein LINPERPRIM_LOCUS22452 [Linum perenne]
MIQFLQEVQSAQEKTFGFANQIQCLHRWADEGRKLRKSGGEFSEDEKR